jgi:hypothetical protein
MTDVTPIRDTEHRCGRRDRNNRYLKRQKSCPKQKHPPEKKGEVQMSHNVGGIERGIRIAIGLALLGIAFFHVLTGTLGIIAYIVGGVALLTGLVGYCPAWTVCGINTCAMKQAKMGSSKPV